MNHNQNALLLGVVYSTRHKISRGQEFRDRVRCEALENMKGKHGYNVFSLDNKHAVEGAQEGKHCQANFSDPRRMMQSINDVWGEGPMLDSKFDTIVLDYFFSPAGWARERWSEKFFEKTIPFFAESKMLKAGGTVWLPHLPVTDELIEIYEREITKYYDIKYVSAPKENPLYMATECVTDELLKCPDKLTNKTQLLPLMKFSKDPFVCLTRKDESNPLTPPRRVKQQRPEVVILNTDSPNKRPRRGLNLE